MTEERKIRMLKDFCLVEQMYMSQARFAQKWGISLIKFYDIAYCLDKDSPDYKVPAFEFEKTESEG